MPVVQHDVLKDLCYRIFAATGIPADDALIVADHVVESHLHGHDSHGTWLVSGYARGMRDNYVRWEETEVVRDTPVLRVINGKGANGIVAVNRALDIAVEKAQNSTFGFVGLNHITHICRLGDYPPRIAERGMIGMVWLNGGGLFLAPFGSADRRLRPEPIAFSAPRQDGPPFMLDMTMTVVAGGKIVQKEHSPGADARGLGYRSGRPARHRRPALFRRRRGHRCLAVGWTAVWPQRLRPGDDGGNVGRTALPCGMH